MRVLGTPLGFAVLLVPGGAAAEPVARSGIYDSLTLAVAGDAVAGVFSEQRGAPGSGGPQFSCLFLLRGTLAGGRAKVETWFPGEPKRIPGELAFTSDGATLILSEDHGGCSMTAGTMVETPYTLARSAEGTPAGWIGVGLVTAKRTAFRPEPGTAPARAPYLVRFDPVAVLERRDAWVRVQYRGEKVPVIGWLPAANVALVP